MKTKKTIKSRSRGKIKINKVELQTKAIMHAALGNISDIDIISEGDKEWTPALEYVKLLRRHFELAINRSRISMPIDLNKETEEAYKAFLEETGGINQDGLSLPKYRELPNPERQRFMAMTDYLIRKFQPKKSEEKSGDRYENGDEIGSIQGNTSESELESESKSKPKSKSTR